MCLLCGMRKIGGEYCRNTNALDMSKVKLYDTFERFSEYFDMKENCWTSEQIVDDTYFQMDIPLRDDIIKIHIEFRYGKIEKMNCYQDKIKINCDDIEHPNTKLNNNLLILQQYLNQR